MSNTVLLPISAAFCKGVSNKKFCALTFAPLDISNDEPLFMSELQDESARELLGEFTRRHNLVRWGIFVENVLKYTDSSHLKTYLTENPGREYYPIPEQQVLLSNGNLTNDNY